MSDRFMELQKQDQQPLKISLSNSSYTIYYRSPKTRFFQVNKEEEEEELLLHSPPHPPYHPPK